MSELFDEWTAYEKVVRNDYMHHRTFFSRLAQEVREQLQQPLSILELGCGDCKPVTPLLSDLQIDRYVGVDLSETALALAKNQLDQLHIAHDLQQGAMVDQLLDMQGSFSLVIGSYSLHHLDLSEKQQVLKECRRLLAPGGLMAIVDVFLEEGETLTTYLERWRLNAQACFRQLDPPELDLLFDHALNCDIPETVTTYTTLATRAGFEHALPLLQDNERLNRLLVLG